MAVGSAGTPVLHRSRFSGRMLKECFGERCCLDANKMLFLFGAPGPRMLSYKTYGKSKILVSLSYL